MQWGGYLAGWTVSLTKGTPRRRKWESNGPLRRPRQPHEEINPLLVRASLCFDGGDRASPTSLFGVRTLTPSAFGRNNHNTEVCAAGLAVAAAKEGRRGASRAA